MTESKKIGRPLKEVSETAIENGLEQGCTLQELAISLDVSLDLLNSRFKDAISRGRAKFSMSLRRLQYRSAMGYWETETEWSEAEQKKVTKAKGKRIFIAPSTTMQIFLGKNYLGQSDAPKIMPLNGQISILQAFSECSPEQIRYATSMNQYTALVGGYGSGKTFAEMWRTLIVASKRVSTPTPMVKLQLAPTYRLLKDVNMPKFMEFFDAKGIQYDVRKGDHEIEILSPEYAGQIKFRSADDPQKIVGFDCTDVGIDEFDIMPQDKQKELFIKCLGRMRGCTDPTFGVTTTPEGYKETYEMFEVKKMGELIVASTKSNKHLPDGFEQMLRDQYDEAYQEQYIDGLFRDINNDKVYRSFKRPIHSYEFETPETNIMCLGMDFNVNPMCAVQYHFDGDTMWVYDEYYLPHSGTKDMVETIERQYSFDQTKWSERYVNPDMTGGHASTTTTQTDLSILEKAGFRINGVRVRDSNDTVKFVNNVFDKGKVVIHPRCVKLIRDLVQVGWKNGRIDKSNTSLTHISDAFCYAILNSFKDYDWSINK